MIAIQKEVIAWRCLVEVTPEEAIPDLSDKLTESMQELAEPLRATSANVFAAKTTANGIARKKRHVLATAVYWENKIEVPILYSATHPPAFGRRASKRCSIKPASRLTPTNRRLLFHKVRTVGRVRACDAAPARARHQPWRAASSTNNVETFSESPIAHQWRIKVWRVVFSGIPNQTLIVGWGPTQRYSRALAICSWHFVGLWQREHAHQFALSKLKVGMLLAADVGLRRNSEDAPHLLVLDQEALVATTQVPGWSTTPRTLR